MAIRPTRTFMQILNGQITETVFKTHENGYKLPEREQVVPALSEVEWTAVHELLNQARDIARDNEFPFHTEKATVFGVEITAIWGRS